jgi:hypothetical protein
MAGGPVVFLVLSHHRPRQVERLLARLADTRSAVTVVHHDPRFDERPSLPPGGRAMLVAEPVPIRWGTMTLVQAILHSLRWIRAEIPDFSWVVPVSGQDYPVRPPAAIEAELESLEADASIAWEFVPPFPRRRNTDWQRGTSRRYQRRFFLGTHRPSPLPRPLHMVDGVGMFAGSTWWQMRRRAVDVVLADTPLNAHLQRKFARLLLPDEAYFQTALLNASIGLQIDNRDRRFVRFPQTGGSAHPEVLTIADADAIVASDALFVRKVGPESASLMDRLDRVAPPAGFEPAT